MHVQCLTLVRCFIKLGKPLTGQGVETTSVCFSHTTFYIGKEVHV